MHFTQIRLPLGRLCPKKIHGTIYCHMPVERGSKAPFSIYCGPRYTEINFYDEKLAVHILTAVEKRKLYIGNIDISAASIHKSVSLKHLLENARPVKYLKINLLSPTATRAGKKILPFPLPGNIFNNVPLNSALSELIQTVPELSVYSYELKTDVIKISPQIKILGCVGSLTFKAETPSPELHILGSVLNFTGIGWKTALGMGKTEVFFPEATERR